MSKRVFRPPRSAPLHRVTADQLPWCGLIIAEGSSFPTRLNGIIAPLDTNTVIRHHPYLRGDHDLVANRDSFHAPSLRGKQRERSRLVSADTRRRPLW